jgi:polyketide synthase 12/epothilone polyketide synthase D
MRSPTDDVTADEVGRRVEAAIRSLMPNAGEAFDPNRTVSDLGLDSLALGGLRRLLSEALCRPISSALFFRCPTAASMIAELSVPAGSAARRPIAQNNDGDDPGSVKGSGGPAPARAASPGRRATGWEPIAIIGHAVRMPAGGDTPEAFMDALLAGRDGVRRVPEDRWDVDALTASEPGTLGRMDADQGGFLDRVDLFDPGFFSLSRREAQRLNPQHRLLLEMAWEALSQAGRDVVAAARTAATGRSPFPVRAAIVARSEADLRAGLRGIAQGAPDAPPLRFVRFTGRFCGRTTAAWW